MSASTRYNVLSQFEKHMSEKKSASQYVRECKNLLKLHGQNANGHMTRNQYLLDLMAFVIRDRNSNREKRGGVFRRRTRVTAAKHLVHILCMELGINGVSMIANI